MLLDISDLIKKKVEKKEFELVCDVKSLKRDDFEIILSSPIYIKGMAFVDDENIKLQGTIKTSIKSECSRCLKLVDYPLDIEFDEIFSKKQGEDIYTIVEDRINLENMVIDNIILSLPVKVLCNEDCKGLCPVCGLNLNEGQCDCLKDNIDPRLEALKQFFKGD